MAKNEHGSQTAAPFIAAIASEMDKWLPHAPAARPGPPAVVRCSWQWLYFRRGLSLIISDLRLLALVFLAVLVPSLSGCAHKTSIALEPPASPSPEQAAFPMRGPQGEGPQAISTHDLPEKFRQLGTGALVGQTIGDSRKASSGNIFLNFYDADIREITQFVLGEQLKRNYIIDPAVAGKITVQMNRGLDEEGLIRLFETILSVNNAAIVRESSGLWRIVPLDKASDRMTVPTLYHRGEALPVGYQTRVIPLQYLGVTQIRTILKSVISERLSISEDPVRNFLVAGGPAAELAKLVDTIAVFDVDWMAGMSLGLFPLTFADPASMIKELRAVFEQSDVPSTAVESSTEPVSNAAYPVRFMPIERLNAVLVVTAQKQYLSRAEEWITRLDHGAGSGEQRLFVYRLQNGKSEDIADLLSAAFGSGAESANSDYQGGQVAPSLAAVQSTTASTSRSQPRGTSSAQGGNGRQSVALSIDGGAPVRAVADSVNNSLVILGTTRQYQVLLPALRDLDVAPMQVLIEASIVEVTLTDDLKYGVEWFFKNNFDVGSGVTGRGILDLGASGLGAFTPSFSYALVDNANGVRAVLNALSSRSKVNVLSSPSLMVLGNQTATINVGDQVPIPTRQSNSNVDPSAPTVNEITYRDTGVILNVSPRINSGGMVTMDVAQEVSDVGRTTSSGIDAPTFQQRKISSTVAVQSGKTVVLGGLIREQNNQASSGVPWLSEIPFLGTLFGATSNDAKRTELLVLITPRAVASTAEADAVTREFQSKLEGLKP